VILAVVNIVLGTFLRIITFPIRLITLGAFTFAIFLVVVYVTDYLVPGVTLQSVLPAVTIAVAASVTSFVVKLLS
jgi:putative membrane protein